MIDQRTNALTILKANCMDRMEESCRRLLHELTVRLSFKPRVIVYGNRTFLVEWRSSTPFDIVKLLKHSISFVNIS